MRYEIFGSLRIRQNQCDQRGRALRDVHRAILQSDRSLDLVTAA